MYVGLRKLTIFYDSLRYSLDPSEKMLLSSINRYNDSKRKCLDEYGIIVHKAGQSEKSVTIGVPRFQELLNATKTPRMINCKIFLKEGYNSIQELRETAGHNFVCLTLKDLSNDINVCIDKEEESWYDIFKTLYSDNFSRHNHCISIKLNKEMLFKYKINITDIVKVIEDQYDDLYCVFSPLNNNQLDIFVDTSNIKFPSEKLLFVTEENTNEIYLEECVQPILEKMVICGIPGIKSIYFTNENNEWFIETDGSNFQELLGHPIVNMEKLQSNNVWDIFETLGIEAAREFLIQEFLSIMDGINSCHVKLLVEKMTYSGTISSISRYTLRKDESGPMAKSSFNIWMRKGSFKRVLLPSRYINGKTPGCGNLLRALTTTLVWKLIRGTRLIVVPNGKKVKDWKIRRLFSKLY
jgi:DNA-directed RNA polymerase beta' subunit